MYSLIQTLHASNGCSAKPNQRYRLLVEGTQKVDVRLSGKGNSNSHGARPVHLIITMPKWILTGMIPTMNSLIEETHTAKVAEVFGNVNDFGARSRLGYVRDFPGLGFRV